MLESGTHSPYPLFFFLMTGTMILTIFVYAAWILIAIGACLMNHDVETSRNRAIAYDILVVGPTAALLWGLTVTA